MWVDWNDIKGPTLLRYQDLQHDIHSLLCEAAAILERIDTVKPVGWLETKFILEHAWREGRRATSYWNTGCNYQRLVNAKKELEEALGSKAFREKIWDDKK